MIKLVVIDDETSIYKKLQIFGLKLNKYFYG